MTRSDTWFAVIIGGACLAGSIIATVYPGRVTQSTCIISYAFGAIAGAMAHREATLAGTARTKEIRRLTKERAKELTKPFEALAVRAATGDCLSGEDTVSLGQAAHVAFEEIDPVILVQALMDHSVIGEE